MYQEHPSFTPPPPNAVLWRYLDFTKFVSLLDRNALFFARADRLGDPFEGSYSKLNKVLRPAIYGDSLPPATIQAFSNFTKEARRFTLVNCWHCSDYESAAMWKLYSRERDGIAIKTDFKAMKDSLTCHESVYVGTVRYVDYENTFIDESNIFSAYLSKRKSFEHESEVRALIQDIPSSDGAVDLSRDIHEIGTYLSVNISALIKEVVIAPYAEDWFIELVQSVSNRYGLEAPIRKSSLSETPTW